MSKNDGDCLKKGEPLKKAKKSLKIKNHYYYNN